MNATKAVLIVCSILVATLLGGLTVLSRVHRQQRDLTAQIATRERELATLKESLASTEDTARQLETKLTHVTEALLDTTRQLTQTRLELDHHVVPPKAEIPPLPAPVITGSREEKNHRVVFPELLSKTGRLIARQQEFSNQLGRNLIFKDAEGKRLRLDLEELHPQILATLGIDPQAARQEQQELDAKSAQFNAAARQAQAAHAAAVAQAQKEKREQEARTAVEMARLDEERRKAVQEENIRLQNAENDRLRAIAALRAADAALYQSQPAPIYIAPIIIQNPGGRPRNFAGTSSIPSTVAPPFTPNTVWTVRSNTVQLIQSPKGLPKP